MCGVYNREPSIVDYKTAKKMKSIEWIQDYAMQICAYSMAHNEQFGTNIKKGIIFMVDRNLKFNEFIIEGNDFTSSTEKWLYRLESFLKQQKIER
jgi:genome maintenance exonuclease 1